MASQPTTDATAPAAAHADVSMPATVAPMAAKRSKPIPAPAAMPVANKKAAAKAVPQTAATPIEPAVMPAISGAEAATAKEVIIMEATINDTAEQTSAMFSDAGAKGTKAFAEMNDFGKGSIEAIVESGKIAAKGIEAMGQDAAAYSRQQFEGATAVLKSMSSVKSPTDFFKMQSDFVRASFDSLVAQTSKNTEAMLKLAGEVAQPLQNRVTIAVEKVKLAA